MDFVIPWVDGNDPEWKKNYNKHKKGEDGDTRKTRFRDWENLQYWFRGVERFAPWVDKIHFITCGHLPSWLNENHCKLNIVKHSDFIPSKYLPTFNSRTIALNVHRIKSLQEQYVYFNDDFFIIDKVNEGDFFQYGRPCDIAVSNALTGTPYSFTILRNISIINKYFSKHHAIKNSPLKWFNIKYGFKNLRTLFLFPWDHTGFYNPHLPQPSLKSTLELLWNEEYSILNEASANTFRHYESANAYLQRYWELASNNFIPKNYNKFGKYFELHKEDISEVVKFIEKQNKKVIAFNDAKVSNFESVKKKINDSLSKVFMQKSKFEI